VTLYVYNILQATFIPKLQMLELQRIYLVTYLLTYLWSWALLEELLIVQPLRNPPAFYGTRRFNTVFTRALRWSLSWAISIKSTPSHPISLRSTLILSTHLREWIYLVRKYKDSVNILASSSRSFDHLENPKIKETLPNKKCVFKFSLKISWNIFRSDYI
jgi:hypothetical protein